eukprot:TRINITY_DN17_c0_g1_i1.p1 TRINITY_DN17_c0_g1~~TRINITY_DN17_c0_g1_i1.p1  ORF type:complete len:358 (+),score=141.27 TRINITY_DN17_c0_g1_i1:113-1186(+)
MPPSRTPEQVVPSVPSVPALTDIKKSIPANLFRPSALWSLRFVVQDAVLIAALFAATRYVQLNYTYGFAVLPLYWFLQGTMFWSVFVLGHDCGHGSFSRYTWLNQVFGNILHTFILVPYEMWKLSHRHHHKNTGNIDKDEIFYPIREKEASSRMWLTQNIYFGFGLGWLGYLVTGYYPRPASHFNPFGALYADHHGWAFISLVCWVSWFGSVVYYATAFGQWAFVICYYFIPVYVFASWLVVVTFLHHNEPEKVSWYGDSKWNYVLGNLESVDRDYGIFHSLIHNIGTHQVHHLFPAVPHYNLEEATVHFRKTFPHLIRESKQPIMKAFLNNFRSFAPQQLVGDDVQVHRFAKAKST